MGSAREAKVYRARGEPHERADDGVHGVDCVVISADEKD